jgi:hypothetical protein
MPPGQQAVCGHPIILAASVGFFGRQSVCVGLMRDKCRKTPAIPRDIHLTATVAAVERLLASAGILFEFSFLWCELPKVDGGGAQPRPGESPRSHAARACATLPTGYMPASRGTRPCSATVGFAGRPAIASRKRVWQCLLLKASARRFKPSTSSVRSKRGLCNSREQQRVREQSAPLRIGHDQS